MGTRLDRLQPKPTIFQAVVTVRSEQPGELSFLLKEMVRNPSQKDGEHKTDDPTLS